jgi:hypothetical protein
MSKDKKQMAVLGVLVVVVLAIGAFQFMGPKPKPTIKAEPKKDKPKDDALVADGAGNLDPMKVYIDSLIQGASGPRDPFAPQAVLIEENPGQQGEQQPTQYVNPYRPDGGQRPDNEIEGGFQPYKVDPNQGNGHSGTGSGQANGGGATVVPDNSAAGFSGPYALRGVMIGRSKKMCMLETRDGRQLLALEGQRLGKELETTVVEITESYVVLRHRGEVHNLALLGGN